MKLYKPVFDKKWEIVELDSDLLRMIPGTSNTVCYYKRMSVFMAVCIIQTTSLKQENPHIGGYMNV